MSGLIIKDLLNLKKQILPLGVFFIIYFGISLVSKDSSFFSGMIMIFCSILPITALAYDDRAGWNKYALTMPVSRSMLVISKYAMSLILIGVGAVVVLLFNALFGMNSLHESLVSTCTILFMGVIMLSLSLPLNYKFGIEKSRYVLIGVCVLPAAIISIFSVGISSGDSDQVYGMMHLIEMVFTSNWLIAGELIISAMIFLISMMISVNIIQRKEF